MKRLFLLLLGALTLMVVQSGDCFAQSSQAVSPNGKLSVKADGQNIYKVLFHLFYYFHILLDSMFHLPKLLLLYHLN